MKGFRFLALLTAFGIAGGHLLRPGEAARSRAHRGSSRAAIGLARCPWPKFQGNAQNTGVGLGSGATGRKKWVFRTGGVIRSAPAIGCDGTVYVWSFDGNLYAVSADTGKEKWRARIMAPSLPTAKRVIHRGSSPAILSDGTVIVGSPDGNVYAFHGTTGRERWRFRTGNRIECSPAVGLDGTLYIPSRDGKLYAIDGLTGRERWEAKEVRSGPERWEVKRGLTGAERWEARQAAMQFSPAVSRDGTVYVGTNGFRMFALDGRTGRIKWAFPESTGTPAIDRGGTIYVGGFSGEVFALDGATGRLEWRSSVGDARAGFPSPPAIGPRGMICIGFFGSSGGKLYALDAKTGSTRWSLQVAKDMLPTPVLSSDGTVYVPAFRGGAGKLLALDGATGALEWEAAPGIGIGLAPYAAVDSDGTVYIGSWQGELYAIR